MRLAAHLRRRSGGFPAPATRRQQLVIDVDGGRVLRGGRPIVLSRTEFRLLAYLALHAGRLLTPRQIAEHVWGPNAAAAAKQRYVKIYVQRLRRRIERDPHHPRFLVTRPGLGYTLSAESV